MQRHSVPRALLTLATQRVRLTLPQQQQRGFAVIARHDVGAVVHLSIGDQLILRRTFTSTDSQTFASLTGDTNPLHSSSNHTSAHSSAFTAPIVPGMLTASLFSAVFGSTLPGAVYVRQDVQFVRPLMFDQQVQATVTVNTITPRRSRRQQGSEESGSGGSEQQHSSDGSCAALVECATEVSRVDDGKLIVKGSASVIVPKCQLRSNSTNPNC